MITLQSIGIVSCPIVCVRHPVLGTAQAEPQLVEVPDLFLLDDPLTKAAIYCTTLDSIIKQTARWHSKESTKSLTMVKLKSHGKSPAKASPWAQRISQMESGKEKVLLAHTYIVY